jgi:hypothetical protein
MVNLDQLAARGLRSYERGRWKYASRIAMLVVPIAAICLFEARGRSSCGCMAFVLLGLSVWLRWRDRRGQDIVTTGLVAGSVPLIAGLMLARLDVHCESPAAAPFCTAFSAVIGLSAGAFIAVREARGQSRMLSCVLAATIAALGAGLGCLRLGQAGAFSAVLGIGAGTLAAAMMVRRAA